MMMVVALINIGMIMMVILIKIGDWDDDAGDIDQDWDDDADGVHSRGLSRGGGGGQTTC